MTTADKPLSKTEILSTLQGLSPEMRISALRKAIASATADRNRTKYKTPGDLAADIDRSTVQTPALKLIDKHIAKAIDTGGRLIISIPPQEGKSTRVSVWTPVWALMRDPDLRVVVASYAETLARRNAMQARALVAEHGTGARDALTGAPLPDKLGIELADDHKRATSWALKNSSGGYYATGVGGSLTGRAADLILVDDPVKNMVQADSAREREKVWEWWSSVALTRLAPGAAVIIIMTRWHPDDLVGRLLEQDKQLPPDQRVWDVINIPAIAEDGVPDALRRDYGESLTSARGRSRQDFIQIKQSVGDRVWNALYQGVPVPISGGLFSADEIERTRGSEEQHLVGRIVSVDPSESGHGDEAGVLVMGWDAEGTIWVEADHSRPMRSAVWARTAVDLALSNQCGALVYEAFTAKETYRNVIEQAWRDIRDNARLLRKHDLDVVAAFNELTAGRDFFADADDDEINPLESLNRVLDIIDFVPDQDVPPFLVVPWTAKGDKVARAAGARQSVSIGKLRMAGTHNVLETQMKTWQQGQGSPDRVDALVNGHDHIAQQIQAQSDVAFPGDY